MIAGGGVAELQRVFLIAGSGVAALRRVSECIRSAD